MDFRNTDPYNDYRDPNILNVRQKKAAAQTLDEAGVKKTINELSKLTDGQLLNELSKQIAIKQQNGTIGDIEKTIKTVQPFLNSEQKKRLNDILKSVRG
jgi:cell fate (sporulation/competence/biofilm development) regulator YmcA (YheA/YmcA/DUF963 family)